MSNMNSYALDTLPPLPQVEVLKRITSALSQHSKVVALWLGGSFARGSADEFSDIDLRVAIADKDLSAWAKPDLRALIGEPVAGVHTWGWEGTVLHHTVLTNGTILDLLVQSADAKVPDDATLILACRDPALQQRLESAALPPAQEFKPADPDTIRQLVVNYWIDSHKHAKVLHRGLDMLVLIGLTAEQSLLMRLWHVETTGLDQPVGGGTIHSLTKTIQPLMRSPMIAHYLGILGTPRRTRVEIVQAIEANRDEVARVGRQLAATLGFEYPYDLEQMVRRTWKMAGLSPSNPPAVVSRRGQFSTDNLGNSARQ